MRELLRRLKMLFHRAEYERELEEEMAHHLALLAEERHSTATARRQFGNTTSLREESRSMWTFAFLEQLAQDVRYALRAMAANPLFTATAALSLALGIGANTAIYSFMDAILLRSLPVSHPEQLAILQWSAPKRPGVVNNLNGSARRYGKTGTLSPNFPYLAYETLGAGRQAFSTLFAYTYAQNFNVIVKGQAESIPGAFASGNYFSGLGVPPAAGRLLNADDDRTGAPPTVTLSYAYWQRRFNGDASIPGTSITISNLPYTVSGVSGPGFFGVDPQTSPDFFLPIHAMPAFALNPAKEQRARFLDNHFYWIEMMGRLQPGVTLQQAQAVMRAQFHTLAAGTALSPKEAEVLPELSLEEGGAGIDSLRRQYSKPLYVLMTMVGLILAIACANLANLLLARAAARRREIAVRLSLGAGRWRIVRQMLTESVLLSVIGGALGLFVAFAGIRMITWLIANGRAHFTLRAELNWPVLAFTFGLAVLAGMLFGLAPAIQATKVDFTPALKESRVQGPAATGHRFRPRLSHVLIVTQIAVSLLLVVAAGLFVRTLSNLHSIDVGFNRENILLVNLNGRQAGYRDAALVRFYSGLLDKFREIPGVRGATASTFPLVAQYINDEGVSIPGRPPLQANRSTNLISVEPSFLETMQIPVLLGRGFEPGDVASPAVAVVNQKFATTFFGSDNPLGHEMLLGDPKDGRTLQIVGIAKAAHYNSLQEDVQPVAYVLYARDPTSLRGVFFELRTAGDPMAAAAAVRRIVHEASPEVSINEMTTQANRIEQTISQERTFANLGACFAVLALLIACVGLYGAMAYTVARRTGEIGIRMALGAQRPKIIWMVLREVLALTAAGLLVGYVAARFTTHLVESFLYGLKANDPLAVAGAVAILLAAAIAAGYIPAWRASRIDPAVALRNE
ncbi:MAG TPA: ABC transporter permease [Candidatus Sulfopaludibacter sp.]|jgi:predicted permease|nr:ABC transporter permease [Candidatus Sulfopaludibacter sp.]